MFSRNARCELCCFAATCCSVAAFMLVVFSFEYALVPAMAGARFLLVVGAGIAFVLMVVLTAIAVGMARNDPGAGGACEECTSDTPHATAGASANSASTRMIVTLLASMALLAGCATGTHPRDPYEHFNRGVYRFNDGVDWAIIQPAARAYRAVLPSFVRESIGNVFSNLGDVRNTLNNALQVKFREAYADFGRVMINSTLGLGGLFDIAGAAGVEKHNEDFGQTLGVWGVESGSFLMLPILGPSSTRDALGRVFDFTTDPLIYVNPASAGLAARGTEGIDVRSQLLEVDVILKHSLDPYLFLRDAYLQRREALVRDGRPGPVGGDVRLTDLSE
jgi:phospholipid-binding lipoprotein MlaA